MKNVFLLLIGLGLFVITGCKGSESSGSSTESDSTLSDDSNSTTETITAALNNLNIADFASGSTTFAFNRHEPSFLQEAFQLIVPSAYATSYCGELAILNPCSDQQKSAIYDACTIPLTQLTLEGSVTLDFDNEDSNCELDGENESVTRTVNFTRDAIFGGSLTVSSEMHEDYRGISLGGGAKMTRTALGSPSAWQYQILGYQRVRGDNLMDISIRTSQAIEITGDTLLRQDITIDGGELEVINNKNEFVTVLTPNQLQYKNSCCYPTSGSIDLSFSGIDIGSGTVTFSDTCGQITITTEEDEVTKQIFGCI